MLYEIHYSQVLRIAHYLTGDYLAAERLLEENLRIGGPTGPHMDIFRASTYAELGQEEKARSLIRELIKSHPDFPFMYWLGIYPQSSEDLSNRIDNLHRLGLPQQPTL